MAGLSLSPLKPLSGCQLEDRMEGGFSEFLPPPPQTQHQPPRRSTYIHDLFINLLTLIYDPWLDPVLAFSGYFFLFWPLKMC